MGIDGILASQPLSGNTSGKKILLVLDWSNLLYRSLFVSHLFGGDGGKAMTFDDSYQINQFIGKFTLDVTNTLKLFRPANTIIAVDSGQPWRKDLLPEEDGYKGNRKKTEGINWDNVYKASDSLLDLFKQKGCHIAKTTRAEADDMVALCKEVVFRNHPDYNVIIVSSDADLRQLIDFNTITHQYCAAFNTIQKPKTGKKLFYVTQEMSDWMNEPNTQDIFFSTIDFSKQYLSELMTNNPYIETTIENPGDVVMGKIFCGDDSDNVPAFYEWYNNGRKIRITPTKYVKIRENLEIKSMSDLLKKQNFLTEQVSKIAKRVVGDLDGRERLHRQRKLVELNSELFPEEIKEYENNIDDMVKNPPRENVGDLTVKSVLENTNFAKVFTQSQGRNADIFGNLSGFIDETVARTNQPQAIPGVKLF